MMISCALYFGFFRDLSPAVISYFSYPLWLMATPALFYGGFPILRMGFASLLCRRPTMETLIAIASLSAYSYKRLPDDPGSLHLYFDTASMLITLVLLGRYIEIHAREKVAGGILDLYQMSFQKVPPWGRKYGESAFPPYPPRREGGGALDPPIFPLSPAGGGQGKAVRERWVSSEAVRPGDLFVVLAGERVPLRWHHPGGAGDLDESILTGEARPVRRDLGDAVKAGSLLLDGKLRIRATRIGRESSLGQMISLMQEALDKKNPAELAADRITRWFVPAILAIAGPRVCPSGYYILPGMRSCSGVSPSW